MIRFSLSLFIAALLVATVQQAIAGTYAVGTCKPKFKSYSTISAAVSSVPAGSHVVVCPGTYPEQVSITQPLTLEGISSGNSGRAIITVPGEAQGNPQLQVNSSWCLVQCNGVAAQLLVQNVIPPGSVVVSNITVDGTGGAGGDCSGGGFEVVGIYYAPGSSGTILRSTARHQQSEGCGYGIGVQNSSGTNESVTVRDNSVHDADIGIMSEGSALSTTIAGNFVTNINSCCEFGAISAFGDTATVETNFITRSQVGINGDGGASVLIASNELADSADALALANGAIAKSNAISNSPSPIFVSHGATAEFNTIMNAVDAIASDSCYAGAGNTITGNTINDTSIALSHISDQDTVTRTRFNNVDTIETGCN